MICTQLHSMRLLSLTALGLLGGCGDAHAKSERSVRANLTEQTYPRGAFHLVPEFGEPKFLGEECEGIRLSLANGEPITASFPEAPVTSPGPRTRVQRRCTVEVPVNVPPGFRAALAPGPIRWAGGMTLTQGGTATVFARAFFAGESGSALASKNFRGPLPRNADGDALEPWAVSSPEAVISSACVPQSADEPPAVTVPPVLLDLQFTLVLREGEEAKSAVAPREFSMPSIIYKRCDP